MPDQPLLLYDGQCGFCRDWARRLARWDRRGLIRMLPFQDRHRIPALPPITEAELARALHVVTPDGRIATGAYGIRALLPWLPGGRLLGWLARIPGVMGVADRCYQAIARRRHRCAVPSGSDRVR